MDRTTRQSGDQGHDERAGRVLNDYLDRRARGEAVTPTELLAQHPDLADDLRLHLVLLRELQPADDRIEGLLRQGLLSPSPDRGYRAALGPYRIVDFIGRGGTGIVLEAMEGRLNRTVALKILRPELADDVTALARFEREARAAAGLQHPNIVIVFAVGQEREAHFIAMEYVAGPSLAEVIRSGWLTSEPRDSLRAPPRGMNAAARTDPIRHLFRELLSALDAAHRAGLIHRDVKPSNILLDTAVSHQPSGVSSAGPPARADGSDGTSSVPRCLVASLPRCLPVVKLADFGLARMRAAHTQLTQAGSVFGTPDYMSPEQARGDPNIDHRTDLYSAGVVLYEMLTGRTPFRADSPTATLRRILDDLPAHPRTFAKGADPHLAALALRLMAKQPEGRFASAADALAALDAPGSLTRAARRRRALRLACVGALLVCGITLGLWPARSPLRRFWRSATSAAAHSLSRVELDPNQPTRRIWACDAEGQRRVFADLPAEVGQADAVALVNDATGHQLVAIGIERPTDLGQGKGNLCALDAAGVFRWSVLLSSDWVWPGCDPPGDWRCTLLQTAELDGRPGDELIAVASDHVYYPSLIAVIDSTAGHTHAAPTFWHAGDIKGVQVEPDFFGPGQPALVAWGVNNKLDETAALCPDWAGPTAAYDFVAVVMILDPRQLEGSGPPALGPASPLPARPPHAYAFLDFPASTQAVCTRDGIWTTVHPEETAAIASVNPPHIRTTEAMRPWKELHVRYVDGKGRIDLVVDRDLNLLAAPLNGEESLRTSEQDWRDRWHPVVQRGQYVFPQPATTPAARDDAALTAVILDEHDPAALLGRRGRDGTPTLLRRFPEGVHVGDAALVDVDGSGARVIAAGLSVPMDSTCLLVLDTAGAELWQLDLSDDHVWPDCGPPTRWLCRDVLAADLDGLPGDEIVAVARDFYEYPARISVIDPRTRSIRSTFWHYGDLSAVQLAPDFFGPGRPALFTFGLNNKLDGFATSQPDDEPPRTRFDVVSVAMLLDPADMNGLGPPRTARLPDRPPAHPYAYAFLNLPARADLDPGQRTATQAPDSLDSDAATLMQMAIGSYTIPDDTGPWFACSLAQPGGRAGPGVLVVDRHLSARHFVVSFGETRRTGIAYWRDHWQSIIPDFAWLPRE